LISEVKMRAAIGVTVLPFLVSGRDVVFPPVLSLRDQLPIKAQSGHPIGGFGNVMDELIAAPFEGLTTFAHLPYLHCLSPNSASEPFDIAILGAPFDTVGLVLKNCPAKIGSSRDSETPQCISVSSEAANI
jgi:hypothetical protein